MPSGSQCLHLQDLDTLLLNTPITPRATLHTAWQQLQPERVLDDNMQPYSLFCSIDEFRKYGPGFYLSIKFLKHFLILFALLSPLAMINVINLVESQPKISTSSVYAMLQSTTLFYGTEETTQSVININIIMLLLIAIGISSWRAMEAGYVEKCMQVCSMVGYRTAFLKQIPEGYEQEGFRIWVQQHYGQVSDISTITDYGQDVMKYMQIGQSWNALWDQLQLVRADCSRSCRRTIELFLQYRSQHMQMQGILQIKRAYRQQIAFITFKQVSACRKMLKQQRTASWLTYLKNQYSQPDQPAPKYNYQRLNVVACKTEPVSIYWQNLFLSRRSALQRTILIVFLLMLEITGCILIVFVISVVDSTLFKSRFSSMTKAEIQELIKSSPTHVNADEAMQAYCLNQSIVHFLYDVDCSSYSAIYQSVLLLNMSMPIVLMFLNLTLMGQLRYLVTLRRYRFQINNLQWKMVVGSLFSFIRLALIKLMMIRQFDFYFFKFSLLHMFIPLLEIIALVLPIQPDTIQVYQDFSRNWLTHISRKIIPVALVTFNTGSLLQISRRLIVKWMRAADARKQTNQVAMNGLLRGLELQLDAIYTHTISIVLFVLLYFPIMPVIIPFITVALFIVYWITKLNLLRVSRRPTLIAHNPNRIGYRMLLAGLVMHCLITPLFMDMTRVKDEKKSYWQVFYLRFSRQPVYILFAVKIVIYWMFGSIIHKKFQQCKVWLKEHIRILQGKQQKREVRLDENQDNLEHYISALKIFDKKHYSYKICDQPKYNKALKTLSVVNKYTNHPQQLLLGNNYKKLPRHKSCKIFTELKRRLREEYDSVIEEIGLAQEKTQTKGICCKQKLQWYKEKIAIFEHIEEEAHAQIKAAKQRRKQAKQTIQLQVKPEEQMMQMEIANAKETDRNLL